jgi:hypothetical protein
MSKLNMPFSSTVERGRFVSKAGPRSTSPAGDPGDPPPPSAAPAAGGWGCPRSRRVHRVGSSRVPAGGVVEATALLVWSLVVVLAPSAVVLCGAERSPSPCSWFVGTTVRVYPSPDLHMWRIRVLKLKKKMVCRSFAATLAFQGVGSSDPLSGDFPAAEGLAPNQGVKRSSVSSAPPARSARRCGRDLEGPVCNFFFSLDLFCKNGALISSSFSQKKKSHSLVLHEQSFV